MQQSLKPTDQDLLDLLDLRDTRELVFNKDREYLSSEGFCYFRGYSLGVLLLILTGILFFIYLTSKDGPEQLSQQTSFHNYQPQVTLAIQAVFIMRENVPFLRQWIVYHLNLGFDKFYLYDNTGTNGHVTVKGVSFATKNVNKYGFDFTKIIPYSQEQIEDQWESILQEYRRHIVHVKWQQKDQQGNIIYAQPQSIVHYLKNYGGDNTHTCFTDVDEFVFSEKGLNIKQYILQKKSQGYQKLILSQKKFEDRYCHPGKKITQIYNCFDVDTRWWAVKVILRNAVAIRSQPSTIHSIQVSQGKWLYAPFSEWRFNHYNVNRKQLNWMRNVKYRNLSFKKCYDTQMRRYSSVIDQHCRDRCSDKNLILQYKEFQEVDHLCINSEISYQ